MGDDNAEAKILRTRLRLAVVQRDPDKAKETASELRNLLTQYASYKNVATTQTFQMACDILACYYIVHCESRDASEMFRKELDARDRQQAVSDIPLWHRPPEKLRLYHMFMSQTNATGTNVEKARELLEYRGSHDECEPYQKEFEATIFKDYRKYQDTAGWLKGTVLDANLNTIIKNNMLERGWRY